MQKNKKTTIADVAKTVEELAMAVNKGFSDMDKKFEVMDKKFDKVNKKLDNKPDTKEMFEWGDKQIIPLGLDVDKIKYIHRQEFKKLPSTYEISRALVEEGLKKRNK